jgi:hypothetical protein
MRIIIERVGRGDFSARRVAMSQENPSEVIRGYVWYAFHEGPEDPFSSSAPCAEDAYRARWPIGEEPGTGVHNIDRGVHFPGLHDYLIVTETPSPPVVEHGWGVEPARLKQGFAVPGLWLVRIVATLPTNSGPLQECELAIDWDAWPGPGAFRPHRSL